MDAYAKSNTPREERDRRATPPELVDALVTETGIGYFDVDICAEPHTAKADVFYTAADDSLSFHWYRQIKRGSFIFMNPPYSDPLVWCRKAASESRAGLFIVGVLPDDRGTRWYQECIEGVATHAWLPTRRMAFLDVNGKPQAGNPKPTVCPIWTPWRTGTTTYSRIEVKQ